MVVFCITFRKYILLINWLLLLSKLSTVVPVTVVDLVQTWTSRLQSLLITYIEVDLILSPVLNVDTEYLWLLILTANISHTLSLYDLFTLLIWLSMSLTLICRSLRFSPSSGWPCGQPLLEMLDAGSDEFDTAYDQDLSSVQLMSVARIHGLSSVSIAVQSWSSCRPSYCRTLLRRGTSSISAQTVGSFYQLLRSGYLQ